MPKRDPFRSGLERRIAAQLRGLGVPFDHEPFKVRFTQPAKSRLYLPDFVLPNGIILEAKGRWETADRRKFLFIEEDWPDLDIRFVFSNAHQTISKQSDTTYAMYCDTNGWLWAHREVPRSWVKEPKNKKSIRSLQKILKLPINQ
jgi:hypothetical protein